MGSLFINESCESAHQTLPPSFVYLFGAGSRTGISIFCKKNTFVQTGLIDMDMDVNPLVHIIHYPKPKKSDIDVTFRG